MIFPEHFTTGYHKHADHKHGSAKICSKKNTLLNALKNAEQYSNINFT